ncbi:DNA-binding response regulator [Sphingomonas sp. ABOLD]|uniref:Two-component system response regulator TctD n=1 Tax=Sphingomonas trueperi TaxID=53317 RepID=A0A7X6BAI5_9SPHN|nr:response regulator transcription factor [Sphingomonas sp. ABOLD]NJB95929.1 two-component system response regulator TctD [Sphingomonas trueperi]RSV39899.1 DNA-binding response regulator [Sphingomonas sp. ABOLD]
MRVLMIEDDQPLATALMEALKRRGIQSDVATNLTDGRQMLEAARYAALLLDLGLPDGDGLCLVRSLRAQNDPIPVIAVSARSALDARIAGLNAGADDYVVKPFDVDELTARLHAVLRRQGALAGAELRFGNVRFDTVSGDLMVGEAAVLLTARERQFAALLLRRFGQVVSKQLAEDQLYGLTEPVGSNALEVQAYRLRRKLEAAGATLRIETIRGVGYLMRDIAA